MSLFFRHGTLLSATLLAMLCAAPATAQGVAGKAVVDGRTVSLFDDFTWKFDDAATGCETVTSRLQFCGKDLGWKTAPKPTPDYAAAYRLTDRLYGGYIFEEIGSDQGLNPETVRSLLLDILKNALNVTPVVIESSPARIDGNEGETLVYGFNTSGIDVVYANSFVLSKDHIVQILTYEVGSDAFSDAHRRAHEDLVAATRYNAD